MTVLGRIFNLAMNTGINRSGYPYVKEGPCIVKFCKKSILQRFKQALKGGLMVYNYNPVTEEAEAEQSHIQGQPGPKYVLKHTAARRHSVKNGLWVPTCPKA